MAGVSLHCRLCGGLVEGDELAWGQIQRDDSRPFCAACAAVLRRPLSQTARDLLQRPTYRCDDPRHPGLPRYSFSTMTRVRTHRRLLREGRSFCAPPWPPQAAPSRSRRWRTLALLGGAAGVIVLGAWLGFGSQQGAAAGPGPTDTAPAAAVAAPSPTENGRSQAAEAGLERPLEICPPAHATTEASPIAAAPLNPLETAGEPEPASAVASAADPPPSAAAAAASPVAPAAPVTAEAAPSAPAAPEAAPSAPSAELGEAVAAAPTAPERGPARRAAETRTAPPTAAPERSSSARARKAGRAASLCEVSLLGPAGAQRVLDAAKPQPEAGGLPWPWPSGVDIFVATYDRAQRRMAIELQLPGVSEGGGACVVVHPARAERQALTAIWSDGRQRCRAGDIALSGQGWQTITVPAAGFGELALERLRLRLEDGRELDGTRPFLVAGAATRSAGPPQPDDCPLALPLLLPASLAGRADAAARFHQLVAKLSEGRCEQRRFAWHQLRILLPGASRADGWRSALRRALAERCAFEGVPEPLLVEMPATADLVDPARGWPEALGDLSECRVLALGWRGERWGADGDLPARLDACIAKALSEDRRRRRPALVPVFVLGEIDTAQTEEREVIETVWRPQAQRLAARGVPVIDLTAAQYERGRDQIALRAAQLFADGLYQLAWMQRPR
ncbi:MAG: hypothetical protein RMM29_07195 [Planctomycetota bacterium]|nr:hypothetical protein [Planctomycetota bacterium]